MKDVAVIIPIFNEADTIENVLNDLYRVGLTIVVCGVSPSTSDNSIQIIKKQNANFVISPKHGYDFAAHEAFIYIKKRYPTIKYILFADAGRKYSFSIVKTFYSHMQQGTDLVLGVRTKGGRNNLFWHQKLGTYLVLTPINFYFRTQILDISPFRMIKKEVLDELRMKPSKFRYPSEMLIKCLALRKKVIQVPIISHKRKGKSKVSGSLRNSIRAGFDMISSLRFVNFS